MIISSVAAYQIFDSRGVPTLEVEIILQDGSIGRGLVPSGASTGQFEALELRDGDPQKFNGKSVSKAIQNVHDEIAPLLLGRDSSTQEVLDAALIELDGTPSKSRLGANAILGASLACANAAAASRGVWLFEHLRTFTSIPGPEYLLPLPEIQIFGGGAHAGRRLDVQDFLLIATGAGSYAQALEITHNVYQAAGKILRERGALRGVADEGGFWPEFSSSEHALQTLVQAIERAGYQPGREAAISLDVAASEFFEDGAYHFEGEVLSPAAFAGLQQRWCEEFPIVSLEDPMSEGDWDGWDIARQKLGDRVQLIGDDLFTTNLARIEEGISRDVANAVLIKLNQIGTVTETLAAIARTQQAGWNPVVSARSGETEDAFISHLSVATDAGQLKVGSFTRSERMVKWNELLRIERRLGKRARFEGAAVLRRLHLSNPHL